VSSLRALVERGKLELFLRRRPRRVMLTRTEAAHECCRLLLEVITGRPATAVDATEFWDDYALLDDDAEWLQGWAEASDRAGDVKRAGLFRDLLRDAEEYRARTSWAERTAREYDVEDPAQAARLRAIDAKEKHEETARKADALHASRARWAP
jgi:hypothetical protein